MVRVTPGCGADVEQIEEGKKRGGRVWEVEEAALEGGMDKQREREERERQEGDMLSYSVVEDAAVAYGDE